MILTIMFLYAVLFNGYPYSTNMFIGVVIADMVLLGCIGNIVNDDPLFHYSMERK